MSRDLDILRMSPSFMEKEDSEKLIEDIEFAEECGLELIGLDEDGKPEFVGDNDSWEKYNNGGK